MNYLRVKDITKIGRGASPRPIDNPLFFDDENGEFAWVRISDVTSSNKYLLKTDEKLSELGSKFSVKLTKPTLFLSIAGSVGKPCINKIKACIHDGFIYFKKPKYNIDYLYWFFNNPSLYEGKGKVGTQLNLNSETVGGLFVPHISYEQQTAIANYLDHNTTKLDKEISLLEQKVEKLDEYKQALIYETVTKGLDKNVPMKDSGIEWIGMIPKHWEVKRLINEITYLSLPKAKEGSSSYLEIGDVNIYNNSYSIVDKEKLSVEGARLAPENTLLISTVRPNRGGITITKYKHPVSSAFCAVKNPSKYWFYFIKNKGFLNELVKMNMDTTYPTCKDMDIVKQFVSVPKKVEQQQIAEYLDEQCSKIDKKKELINKKVELLKEYKQSFIYEAVTGKIEIGE